MFEEFIGKNVKYIYTDSGRTFCAFGVLIAESDGFIKINDKKRGLMIINFSNIQRVELDASL